MSTTLPPRRARPSTIRLFGRTIPEEVDTTIENAFNRLLDAARRCGDKAAAKEAEATKRLEQPLAAPTVPPAQNQSPNPFPITAEVKESVLPAAPASSITAAVAAAAAARAAIAADTSASQVAVGACGIVSSRRGDTPRERVQNMKVPAVSNNKKSLPPPAAAGAGTATVDTMVASSSSFSSSAGRQEVHGRFHSLGRTFKALVDGERAAAVAAAAASGGSTSGGSGEGGEEKLRASACVYYVYTLSN